MAILVNEKKLKDILRMKLNRIYEDAYGGPSWETYRDADIDEIIKECKVYK
jgi:hypothetical protein